MIFLVTVGCVVLVSQWGAFLVARRLGSSVVAAGVAAAIHFVAVLALVHLPPRADGSPACGAAGALILLTAMGGAIAQALLASLIQIVVFLRRSGSGRRVG